MICRTLGGLLAGTILVARAMEVADQLHHQGRRSAVTTRDYMRKARDCVHGRSGPAGSWEICEVVAEDSE